MAASAIVLMNACACDKQDKPDTPDVPETLDTPSGVTAGTAESNSLSFSWNAVSGAESYTYKLLEGLTLVKNGSTNSTNIKIDGLTPQTTYKFAVRSVKGTISSEYSSYIEKATLKDGKPDPEDPDPEKIDNLYEAMKMPSYQEDNIVRAFPGADGGGMLTTGGRGGKILHVTRLADDKNEGSLRWAIEQKGARIVVFDVAGTINLTSRLEIKNGDITIAGQTAPGDGICLKGHNVRINTSNVIIRFMRFRMGDTNEVEDDALNCYTKEGFTNVIIDHCSMSWSTDECGSFYGIEGFTLQWCILSESLRISVHGKGQHGYGGIWGGKNASFHHNLLAHHDSRNPRFDHDYVSTIKGDIHYYNNVIYNWGNNSAYGGESAKGAEPRRINMVNNYYKPGEATSSNSRTRIANPTTKCSNCNGTDQYDIVPGKFYISGNYMSGSEEVTKDNWKGVQPDDKSLIDVVKSSSYQGEQPSWMQTAEKAYTSVTDRAGASLKRDKIDTRIAKETKEGNYTYKGSKGSTGGLIDSQEDVGGWPSYSATEKEISTATKDTDGDGIPDYYEALFGLNKNAADADAKTIDKKGRYTNFEMYLHFLVRDVMAIEN